MGCVVEQACSCQRLITLCCMLLSRSLSALMLVLGMLLLLMLLMLLVLFVFLALLAALAGGQYCQCLLNAAYMRLICMQNKSLHHGVHGI